MDHEINAVGIGKAAKLLGLSRETLRRWANSGVFPPDAIELSPGGHRRFRIAIIRDWAKARALKLINKKKRKTLQQISEPRFKDIYKIRITRKEVKTNDAT
ncbi:MAG: helix-turn-helix domain-containing protein [Planctomycetota bacterium]|jgi:excisionase family DNA binding protein